MSNLQFIYDLGNRLDKTANYLKKPLVWALILPLVIIGTIYWRRRAASKSKPAAVAAAPAAPKPNVKSPTYTRAVYLARESAKLVAQSLEDGSTDVLRAYAGAVQASVLAQTAKELVDDMTALSHDLGVDMFEYLTYTSNVLRDAQDRLTATMQQNAQRAAQNHHRHHHYDRSDRAERLHRMPR